MFKGFVDRWKNKESQSNIISKVRSVGKPPQSLKEQIGMVIQRIDVQTRTLDLAVQRFESRDVEIFNRVVKAYGERDTARANILATELSEIRKIEKMLSQASLAMQSVSMRLNTVSEIGDVVTILSPAKNVINNIQSEMCGILPEASQELGNIGNLLSDIVINTNQTTEVPLNTARIDPEAEQILREAESEAGKKLKQQLPEITPMRPAEEMESVEA